MRTSTWLTFLAIFASCTEKVIDAPIEPLTKADSVLANSIKIHETSKLVLVKADSTTVETINEVVKTTKNLTELNRILSHENLKLKGVSSFYVPVIHDTIYITEKKNFWGKVKSKDTARHNSESELVFSTKDSTNN